jgi:UPF0042 nucleotide-binding protein
MPKKKSRTIKKKIKSRAGKKAKARPHATVPATPLIIVTGLSGSGKTLVLKTLEDLGYYCVDNLPIALMPSFADLYLKTGGEITRAALGIDSREGAALKKLPQMYRTLRRDLAAKLLFVEARDEALLRRFSETRRPHPLGAQFSVREGIRRERRMLQVIREQADVVVDTTQYSPHDLRRVIQERFGDKATKAALSLSVVSFAYRHGVPSDADLIFDTRFLPNPHFVPAYRRRTGKDKRVAQYVFSFPQSKQFLSQVADLLKFLLPYYVREGKSYLTLGFGCTGGRHRSVAVAEAVAKRLAGQGHRVKVHHRDVAKGG